MSETATPDLSKEDFKKALEGLYDKVKEVVLLHQPTDMVVDKVLGRSTVIMANIGPTRTSALSALVMATMTAPTVGLDRQTMLNIINGVYDAMEGNETIKAIAEKYTKMNQEHHAQQAGFMAPKTDIVH